MPTFSCLGFSVVSLVSLNVFLYNLFLTPLINNSKIKLLTKIIANLFGNNFSIIAHPSYNSYISEQAPGMSFKVGVVNLLLGVNAIFDTWSQYSSCFGNVVFVMNCH